VLFHTYPDKADDECGVFQTSTISLEKKLKGEISRRASTKDRNDLTENCLQTLTPLQSSRAQETSVFIEPSPRDISYERRHTRSATRVDLFESPAAKSSLKNVSSSIVATPEGNVIPNPTARSSVHTNNLGKEGSVRRLSGPNSLASSGDQVDKHSKSIYTIGMISEYDNSPVTDTVYSSPSPFSSFSKDAVNQVKVGASKDSSPKLQAVVSSTESLAKQCENQSDECADDTSARSLRSRKMEYGMQEQRSSNALDGTMACRYLTHALILC